MPLEDQAQVVSLRRVTKPNSEAEAAPTERAHPTAADAALDATVAASTQLQPTLAFEQTAVAEAAPDPSKVASPPAGNKVRPEGTVMMPRRVVATKAPSPEATAQTVRGGRFESTLPSQVGDEGLIEHFPEVATGRYDELQEVGRGATGRVLLAEDMVLQREVAVKELHAPHGEVARRFAREVMITSRLQHPSIVPVHDAGRREDGSPFYVMKLVRGGRTLASAMEESSTLAERMALLPQVLAVANAIAFAHSQGIVHRDLKPANVLMGAFGETIVADWGLAKDLNRQEQGSLGTEGAASDDEEATQLGDILGTPAYMAPEQARGEPADRRSDVFALGVILYRLLSGRKLHEGAASYPELLLKIVNDDPIPLAKHVPELPEDLLAIVNKAIAREPTDRFESAAELAQDLEAFLKGQLVSVHRYSRRQLFKRWLRRNRAVVSVGSAAVALLLVFGAVSIVSVVKERNVARQERERALAAQGDAQSRLAELYEEQGRQALVGGDAPRSLLYLNEAYSLGRRDTRLRFMLARAATVLDEREVAPFGHTASVNWVDWTPDGSRLVTASADGSARVWSTSTGAEQFVFRDATGALLDVAISRDGRRAAVSGTSGSWIFDPSTGQTIAKLAEKETLVLTARFSPDSRRVVTGDGDGVLRLWRTSDGQLEGQTQAHAGAVDLVTFDPSGERLLSVSADRTGAVWEGSQLKLIRRLSQSEGEIMAGAFSPDGKRVSSCGFDTALRVWSTENNDEPKVFPERNGWIFACPFSPDGKFVAGASAGRVGVLWDSESGQSITLRGHLGEVLDMSFSPNGKYVATASKDGSARVWDASNGLTVSTLVGHGSWIKSLRFSPDSARIATASEDATARIWDAASGKLLHVLASSTVDAQAKDRWTLAELTGAKEVVASVALGTDGRAVTASHDGVARIYALPENKLQRELRGHEGPLLAALFAANGTVVTAGTTDATVQLWDSSTGKSRLKLGGHKGDLTGIGLDGSRTRLISSSTDGTALVWNTEDGAQTAKLLGHGGPLNWAALTVDGRRALTVSDDRSARIWELPSGRLERVLELHKSPLWYGAFDATGKFACSASVDNTVGLWNVDTGALLHHLKGHFAPINQCEFSPDSSMLVSASQDGAKVWDVATGILRYSLRNDDEVKAAIFSPDGSFIVTAGQQGLARVWDARSGKLLTNLRGHRDYLGIPVISPDGRWLLTPSADNTARVWSFQLEDRAPSWMQAMVRCRVRLRLEGSIAVPSDELTACP